MRGQDATLERLRVRAVARLPGSCVAVAGGEVAVRDTPRALGAGHGPVGPVAVRPT